MRVPKMPIMPAHPPIPGMRGASGRAKPLRAAATAPIRRRQVLGDMPRLPGETGKSSGARAMWQNAKPWQKGAMIGGMGMFAGSQSSRNARR